MVADQQTFTAKDAKGAKEIGVGTLLFGGRTRTRRRHEEEEQGTESVVGIKNPSGHDGQEGRVWLRVEKLIVGAASGPAAQS